MNYRKINLVFLFFFSSYLTWGAEYPKEFQKQYYKSNYWSRISIDEYAKLIGYKPPTKKSRTQGSSSFPHDSLPTLLALTQNPPHASSQCLGSVANPSSSTSSRFTVSTLHPLPEPKEEKENERVGDSNKAVDFDTLEAFAQSPQHTNKELFLSLADRLNPAVPYGSTGMTALDLYLYYIFTKNRSSLSLELIKILLTVGNLDPDTKYSSEKGTITCFTDTIKESSLTNKTAILTLLKELKPKSARERSYPTHSLSDSLPRADRPAPFLFPSAPEKTPFLPLFSSEGESLSVPTSSFQKKGEPVHTHFHTPLLPRPGDRKYILRNCQFHLQNSKENFTCDEVNALIQVVDDKSEDELQFLATVLKASATIHEVDILDKNHFWSLIPYDETFLSLKKLRILLEAGIDPRKKRAGNESFMEYLDHSLTISNAREAHEHCRRYLLSHPIHTPFA
jgi:hypothetical protein